MERNVHTGGGRRAAVASGGSHLRATAGSSVSPPQGRLPSPDAKRAPSLLRRVAALLRTILACCLLGAVAVAVVAVIGAVLFAHHDGFAVPLTRWLVRRNLPTPEEFSRASVASSVVVSDDDHRVGGSSSAEEVRYDRCTGMLVRPAGAIAARRVNAQSSPTGNSKLTDETYLAGALAILSRNYVRGSVDRRLWCNSHSQPHAESDLSPVSACASVTSATTEVVGRLRFGYRRPSLIKYGPHQWLWDSCFHVMTSARLAVVTSSSSAPDPTQPLCPQEYRRALEEFATLLAMQVTHTSETHDGPALHPPGAPPFLPGFIPEMIYWEGDPMQLGVPGWMFGYSRGTRFADLSQMPMIPFALAELWKSTLRLLRRLPAGREKEGQRFWTEWSAPEYGDNGPSQRDVEQAVFDDLDSSFPPLWLFVHWLEQAKSYLDFWRTHRDLDGNGLVSILHPWESGLDASPLYDPVHVWNRDDDGDEEASESALCCDDDGPSRRLDTARIAEKKKLVNPHAQQEAADEDSDAASGGSMALARDMYPEFIVLLYRYRHQYQWNASAILQVAATTATATERLSSSSCSSRRRTAAAGRKPSVNRKVDEKQWRRRRVFNVEDAGVNAVLSGGYDTLADTADTIAAAAARVRRPTTIASPKSSLSHRLATFAHECRTAASVIAAALLRDYKQDEGHWFVSHFYACHDDASPSSFSVPPSRCERRPLRRKTIHGLMPLLLGGRLPPDVAARLVKSLSRDFISRAAAGGGGVATVARSEADVFDPCDSTLMWRGPSWPPTDWIVLEGLSRLSAPMRKASTDEHIDALRDAATVAYQQLWNRSTAMQRQVGYAEYYHPDTGAALGQRALGMSTALLSRWPVVD